MASARVIFKGNSVQFIIGSYNREFTRGELRIHLEKYYDPYSGINLHFVDSTDEFAGYFSISDENAHNIEDPDTNLKALLLYLSRNYNHPQHSTKSVTDLLFYFLRGNVVEIEDSVIVTPIQVIGQFEVPLVAPVSKKGGKSRRKYKKRITKRKITKQRKSYKKI
jgi:hypothetical protein